MPVSSDQVKRLRQLTGASMMLCKKVLEESGGDMDNAMALLKKSSEALAAKKNERRTGAGIIESYIHGNSREMTAKIVEGKLEAHFRDTSLMSQQFIKDQTITVEEFIKRAIAHFGEKIEVARFVRYEL